MKDLFGEKIDPPKGKTLYDRNKKKYGFKTNVPDVKRTCETCIHHFDYQCPVVGVTSKRNVCNNWSEK